MSLRSIRIFIAVAIFATIFAAFESSLARIIFDGGHAGMPSMACATCDHADMSLAECKRVGCSAVLKVASLDHHPALIAVSFAEQPAKPPREWLIVPPVPPG